MSLVATLCLKAEKPNILFIIADDFNPKLFETNEHRQKQIKTPNLDTLREESTVFDNAHIMGSWTGAVCMASRTALNSGFSIWKANSVSDKKNAKMDAVLKRGEAWSQLMKKGGYYTYITGKWHVNTMNTAKIFDKAEYIFNGMFGANTKAVYNRPIEGKVDKWDPSDPKLGGFWIDSKNFPKEIQGKHATIVTADTAVNFLNTYKNDKEQPFFAYVAFNAPHDPRQAPKEYMDMYDLEGVQVPANFVPENANAKVSSIRSVRDETLAPYPRTEFAVKTHMKEYFGSISYLDENIGRILKALKDANFERETIVIFTADHGLAVGEHGYIGKQNMYEASNRSPLFIKGGGFKPNTHVKEYVYMQDIMPTTLEIAGQDVPELVDFKSLMPYTKDLNHKQYDNIYASYIDAQKMIKKDGFKLIWYTKDNTYLFFNVAEDPEELNDLINDSKYADKIAQYKKELKAQDTHFKSLKL